VIPFVDLRAQYQTIKDEVDTAVREVFEGAQFVLGPQVAEFERLFADYVKADRALGVNSGTSALHLAMLAAGIGRGDEVITTPMTFIATASAIDYAGATPVFVDIDPVTLNIDPTRIEDAITPATKAIVPVHLHGLPADLDPILEIAQRRGLTVIEDAAQSHGAEYKGRRAGTIGHIGCFSFYPGKNLGAYGEGGAVVSNDPQVIRTVSMLRDWGCEERYHHELKGFNYRMEGVQGAVLRVKMAYIEQWTDSRRRLAARYDEHLGALGYRMPASPDDRRHVYHVYAIRTTRRDELQPFLHDRGIATGMHYPVPVHLQKAFSELGHARGDFPLTEAAAAEVLSLPMFPEMTDDQQDVVIAALAEWAETKGSD
jgi:dTDP-4-amino-4,6-dideoxygalactose transaminase